MRAAALFAGIGGWEIACANNGVAVSWAAEWDDWKRARYLERWPHATLYRDVAELDGADLVRRHGPVDLLLGSPPCTDISAANASGAGIDGDESRYYLEAIRLVRETGARWIGFENSPRLRTRGADRVLALLEAAGYALWPCVVEAEDAGAPQRHAGQARASLPAEALGVLDAMPRKRLIREHLVFDGWRPVWSGQEVIVGGDVLADRQGAPMPVGSVCLLGSVGRARGIDMAGLDPEDIESVAPAFGIANAMAREIVYWNDERGPLGETPEQRWVRMRKWVARWIVEKNGGE